MLSASDSVDTGTPLVCDGVGAKVGYFVDVSRRQVAMSIGVVLAKSVVS
jgi:hypothetical protein